MAKKRSEFVEYVVDLLQPMGHIRARAMFGGWGLYKDDLMFGLFADDVLYLKVDDENKQHFIDEDLGPFIYEREDKAPVAMSYYEAPASIYDNEEQALHWADIGYGAALRQQKKKPKKRKKKT